VLNSAFWRVRLLSISLPSSQYAREPRSDAREPRGNAREPRRAVLTEGPEGPSNRARRKEQGNIPPLGHLPLTHGGQEYFEEV